MKEFLERAKRLKIEIDPRLEPLAELQDFERDVGEDRAMWEDALRPTFMHEVILERIREAVDEETEKLRWPKSSINVAV